jgi:ATPase subunit of ABC transporter with duplicated ATPase domains
MSGGERARAALAAILLARFDLFLLDEPTNDLDFDGLDRLERFVAGVEGAVAVVSHDRAFLDRTATRIVELEDGTHRAHEYVGGWTEYEQARERVQSAHQRAYAHYDDQRQRLAERLRERRTEARVHGRGAGRRATAAQSSKVRTVERRLERLDPVAKPWEPWELHLSIEPDRRAGDIAVRLTGAVVELGAFRLGPLDLLLGRGERVALVGPNGSGKTTLLRALLGELPLAAGERRLGVGVVVGELDQGRGRFLGREPVLEAFGELPLPEARSLLAKFGLGANDVERPGSSLSPGERTRAALALLVAGRVNCLVLDEPTNHLDLPAIEELESALARFPGTVILVTHDRRFLDAFEPTRTVELPA